MGASYTDTDYRVLEDDEDAPVDAYIGQDDFGSVGRGDRRAVRSRNMALDLADRVQQPGVGVTKAAFIAAPAVYGASIGQTPVQQALYAGIGAAIGLLAYEACQQRGWVD